MLRKQRWSRVARRRPWQLTTCSSLLIFGEARCRGTSKETIQSSWLYMLSTLMKDWQIRCGSRVLSWYVSIYPSTWSRPFSQGQGQTTSSLAMRMSKLSFGRLSSLKSTLTMVRTLCYPSFARKGMPSLPSSRQILAKSMASTHSFSQSSSTKRQHQLMLSHSSTQKRSCWSSSTLCCSIRYMFASAARFLFSNLRKMKRPRQRNKSTKWPSSSPTLRHTTSKAFAWPASSHW